MGVAAQVSISTHINLLSLFLTSQDKGLIVDELFDTIWLSLLVAKVKERIKEKGAQSLPLTLLSYKMTGLASKDSIHVQHPIPSLATLALIMA